MRLTGHRATGQSLGAQLVGAYGAEVSKRLDILATAIHHGSTIEQIAALDLSYTPPLSSPWDPYNKPPTTGPTPPDRRWPNKPDDR